MSVFVDSEKCLGCGICVSICPVEAISIAENIAVIYNDKCNECLQCIEECPTNAIYQIVDKKVSITKRENLVPDSANQTSPYPKGVFWTDKRKQQLIKISEMFLSGIKGLSNNYLGNGSSYGRRKEGVRRGGKKRRRHRRGRY